jgi:hypothetical protein
MPTQGLPLTATSPSSRSRVTNHRDVLPNIDGRSVTARRYRDIVAAVIADQGGLDRIAEARLQLIRRFAACAVLCESQEARMANGEDLDLQEYSTLTSTLVRVAQRIGINRTARDITPTITEYLHTKAEKAAA